MNITDKIGKEIGVGVSEFLKKTPEIQIYANPHLDVYQWHDRRFRETMDRWTNKAYQSRGQMKEALVNHLKRMGDF